MGLYVGPKSSPIFGNLGFLFIRDLASEQSIRADRHMYLTKQQTKRLDYRPYTINFIVCLFCLVFQFYFFGCLGHPLFLYFFISFVFYFLFKFFLISF